MNSQLLLYRFLPRTFDLHISLPMEMYRYSANPRVAYLDQVRFELPAVREYDNLRNQASKIDL